MNILLITDLSRLVYLYDSDDGNTYGVEARAIYAPYNDLLVSPTGIKDLPPGREPRRAIIWSNEPGSSKMMRRQVIVSANLASNFRYGDLFTGGDPLDGMFWLVWGISGETINRRRK